MYAFFSSLQELSCLKIDQHRFKVEARKIFLHIMKINYDEKLRRMKLQEKNISGFSTAPRATSSASLTYVVSVASVSYEFKM